MKKYFLFVALVLSATTLFSQETREDRNFRIPLIGEVAPSFTAESTTGVVNFPADYGRAVENFIQPSTGLYSCMLFRNT